MKRILLTSLVLGMVGVSVAGYWYSRIGSGPPPTPMGPAPKPKNVETPSSVKVKVSESSIDDFPESVEIEYGDESILATYTGHLVKRKKVLVLPVETNRVACYVVDPQEGDGDALADALMVDGYPRALLLRFTRRLPGSFIANDIEENIRKTFTDVDVPRLRSNIDRFVQKFANGSAPGHKVYFVWMPGGRVYIGYETPNNVELIAEDVPFARALWRCYVGRDQPDRTDMVKRYAQTTQAALKSDPVGK
ncbi:MAG: hypothetical protein U1D30_17445 [Planctomycetota bacterium]